jgi:tctex1 domain-containing protein 2
MNKVSCLFAFFPVDDRMISRFIYHPYSPPPLLPTSSCSTTMVNTYQLCPDRKFSVEKISGELAPFLKNFTGSLAPSDFGDKLHLTRLVDSTKDLIKPLLPRYKIFVHAYWFEDAGQAISLASKCLWNKETDDYVSVSETVGGWTTVLCVFGMYYE